MFSLPSCIAWLVVFITESVAIVTLNVVTIIVFINNRDLRKRSTYLLINLAVADMLVGGFTALNHFILLGVHCNLWKDFVGENWLNNLVMTALEILFPVCSLLNITVISAERLHATFWPFSHRAVKKWAYLLTIAVIWVMSMLLSFGLAFIAHFKEPGRNDDYLYLWCSFNSICLFAICVCYLSIIIKVRCGVQPQHHGAASRERKLTMTLLIVTFVSLLLWLPFVLTIFLNLKTDIFSSLSENGFFQYQYGVSFLYYGNSLVNTILYTLRIPEYRKALITLCFKRPQQQRQVEVLLLRVN